MQQLSDHPPPQQPADDHKVQMRKKLRYWIQLQPLAQINAYGQFQDHLYLLIVPDDPLSSRAFVHSDSILSKQALFKRAYA